MNYRMGGLLATIVWVVCGCESPVATPRPVVLMRPVELTDGLTLTRPEGWSAPVAELVWGGPNPGRRLGVRFADGRFAIYWPDRDAEPLAISPPGIQVDTLLLTSAGLPITGNEEGLTCWDLGDGLSRVVARHSLGKITALARGHESGSPILVGRADGRVQRYLLLGNERLIGPTSEIQASLDSAAILAIEHAGTDKGWIITSEHGSSTRLGSDLKRLPDKPAKSHPRGGKLTLSGGASIAIESKQGSRVESWVTPGKPTTGDWLADGTQIVIALPSRLLMIPCTSGKAKPQGLWRELRLVNPMVSVDPTDLESRRLVVADASGRIEVLDSEGLFKRSERFALEDSAEFAFRPWRRVYRPGSGAEEANFPEDLANRMAEVRDRLDSDPSAELAGSLHALEINPALNRHAGAEVASLRAAVEQAAGRSNETVLKTLERARSGFELLGLTDRAAGIQLWQAKLLTPDPDQNYAGNPGRARELLQDLLGAHSHSQPRQSLIAEALLAAIDLAEGKVRQADERIVALLPNCDADPVISESVDWLNLLARSAMLRGDDLEVERRTTMILDRINIRNDDHLRRSTLLRRAQALARQGHWTGSAQALEAARPDDPEWTLIRATARTRAGLADEPSDDPHIAGRRLAMGSDRRLGVEPLARAAELHRRSGAARLADLADLQRAEVLERLKRSREASSVDRTVLRGNEADLKQRAKRGLVRIELSEGRISQALAAHAHILDFPNEISASDFHLGSNQAILAFVATDADALVGFLIRGTEPLEARKLALGQAELDQVVRKWRSRLGDGGRNFAEFSAAATAMPFGPLAPEPELAIKSALRPSRPYSWESYLEDILIGPFASGLMGVTRLTLVLDDSLAAMPIEVIGRDRRLYQRFDLSRGPGLNLLLKRRDRISQSRKVVFWQGTAPVAWAEDEAVSRWREAVGSAGLIVDRPTRGSTALYTLITAKAILDPKAGRWGTTHIDTSPALNGESLAALAMRSQTLILAVGDPESRAKVRGSGIEELARGSLAGSASAVVLTLWDPPAESGSAFLTLLQKGLIEGLGPRVALDRARESMARQARFADPVHWAGYVLYETR